MTRATYEEHEQVGVSSPACDDRHPIVLEIQIRVGRPCFGCYVWWSGFFIVREVVLGGQVRVDAGR